MKTQIQRCVLNSSKNALNLKYIICWFGSRSRTMARITVEIHINIIWLQAQFQADVLLKNPNPKPWLWTLEKDVLLPCCSLRLLRKTQKCTEECQGLHKLCRTDLFQCMYTSTSAVDSVQRVMWEHFISSYVHDCAVLSKASLKAAYPAW